MAEVRKDDQASKRLWGWSWAVALLGCAFAGIRVLQFSLAHPETFYDDSYIYLRFVENTFAGCPFAFNCEDGPVEGFTSPAYLALLLLGRLFVSDAVVVTHAVSTVTLLGALFATSLLCLSSRLHQGRPELGAAAAVVVATLLSTEDFFVVQSITGMETALACWAVTSVLAAALMGERRHLRTAALLSILVRPEFGVFLFVLPVFPEARKARYFVLVVLALCLMTLIRLAVFGDFAPNTYWAKAGGTAAHLRLGLEYIATAAVALPLTAFAGLAIFGQSTKSSSRFFLGALLLALLFQLRSGGDHFPYSRLLLPFFPASLVLGVFGLVFVVGRLKWLSAERSRWWALAFFLGLGVLSSGRHSLPEHIANQKIVHSKLLGRWLAEAPPDTTIALTQVGAIGFYSKKRIIDIVGITQREVAKHGDSDPPIDRNSIGHERKNTAFVMARRPDLIVFLQHQSRPWRAGDKVVPTNGAEAELLEVVSRPASGYRLWVPEITPGLYWVMFADNRSPLGRKY